ncbi:Tyrosine recombinase XerC [Methylobacterium crusticola]|uniref:Tyrosine recombinase XerC n=1 Tax=Methylobacterium crusticola TaxID=1697972 RepID=A0ABQ4QZM8_9HYPH|nr:DUF6538 domain-containing protein [Methylobacterium crusticola]GJD50486.1 Tyrosine recombinase XerC [Methylobacterium crusticola]
MALMTTRPFKHPKTGVYHLRRGVPLDLRLLVGKREEKRSLGTKDPIEAKRLHAVALAELERRWAHLRAGLGRNQDVPLEPEAPPAPRSLSEREAHERAAWIYANWLNRHRENPSQQRFWPTDLYEHLWAVHTPRLEIREDGKTTVRSVLNLVQWERVSELEAWCVDQAETLLFVHDIETDEASKLKLAKAIAAQVQRASLTLAALVRGEPEPDAAPSAASAPARRPTSSRITLTGLVEAWWQEAQKAGRARSTYESYSGTVRALSEFLKHDDATKVTAEDVIAFKDHRLASVKRNGKPISPTTVKNSDLAGLKAVFGWAVANRRLPENPASEVTVQKVARVRTRSPDFTHEEAAKLLRAALNHKRGGERPQTYAAKRWIPWLMAFTGARVGELVQLRKHDVRKAKVEGHPDGVWVLRITPEAGTVKTKQAREVPLHPQLVELGFPQFVEGVREERLFLVPDDDGNVSGRLQAVKNRLAEFAREQVDDPNVSPNHAWRHRFRSVATDAGISGNVIDAICGWSPRSVGERYGTVPLKARADAIIQLPRIVV